jgi:signal transduction histidine kinase/CheY-like chemotaxis protein
MPKVLVVDDEQVVRWLLGEELREEDYEVVSVPDGYELLEKIEEEKPDCVVLDIKMVDYNGIDLLQDIRKRFHDLPVGLYTAYSSFREDTRSFAADFYVIKSADLTELKKNIARALELSDHRWGDEDLSPRAIAKRLIRLLNRQGDPRPVAERVPGYAEMAEDLSKAGFSQEELGEIDVMFKAMCNDFQRENQEATGLIRDYLFKNYKHAAAVSAPGLYDRGCSGDVISSAWFERLYVKEWGALREKTEFLSKELNAIREKLVQGSLSKALRTSLAPYMETEHQPLDAIMERWSKKLESGDLEGIPIDDLVQTFQSPVLDWKEPEPIQNVILRDLRHDLKNTISRFYIFIKQLEAGASKDLLDEVVEIRTKLTSLLERMRELSLFSVKLDYKRVNLNDFIESLLKDLGIQQDSRVKFQIETQSEQIETDPRVLGIAMRQVIQNAVEAVGSDGKIRITARAGEWGKRGHFFIEDSGPGIPENLLEKIFKPGFGYKKTGHGGMGLALCKEALGEIGGEIFIHSVVGEGTIVEIRLGWGS